MKIKALAMVIGAALLAVSLNITAQEKKTVQKPASSVPTKEAVRKPAPTLDEMLKFIPEDVVFIGGKVRIRRKELLDQIMPQLQQALQYNVQEKEIREFAKAMANNMAIQYALVDHLKAKGVKFDRTATDKMLQEYKKKMGREVFEKMLKQQNIDYSTLVTRLTEMNAIQKWQQDILAQAPKTSDAEAEKYYEQHKKDFITQKTFSASHILVKFSSENPSATEKKNALAKINKIRKEILAGAEFATAAKKYSDCPSKERGGDLGEFSEGSMVPQFEAALMKMKTNEISQPVETQFGYHIIKAGPQKPAGQKSYQEAASQIKSLLSQENNRKIIQKKIKEIEAASNIKVMLP